MQPASNPWERIVLDAPNPGPPSADAYTVRTLRPSDLEDFPRQVIHLTGRQGQTGCGDATILGADPGERLLRILVEGQVRAFPMFGVGLPAACFTENRTDVINHLIADDRYKPWGVGFTKEYLFQRGGGPALEVRGDEWHLADAWPDALRARLKRLWPGAYPSDPSVTLPWYLRGQSEWSFEREWRVPLGSLEFTEAHVEFVICPDTDSYGWLIERLRTARPAMASRLTSIRHMTWEAHPRALVEVGNC